MNYKPTREMLIDYLYDELPEEEKQAIEAYLKEHPEERAKLEEMQETSLLFSELEDEEMPQPMAFITPSKNEEWLYWRKYVAVAATLLLVCAFAWLSNFRVEKTNDGWRMAFGPAQYGMSEEEVTDLIYQDRLMVLDYMNTSLRNRNDSINRKFSALQASLNDDTFLKEAFNREREALLNELTVFSEKVGEDYREILHQIVLNFSNNLETQRIEDLRNIQAAFSALEDATVNRQIDMEEAIIDLTERVNAVAANLSNNK
ncbi:anti-sigma factor family protein [Roseivirga thermotolerans]|uniref:anti-sigma factor family protein n=1 Tax=Roseivirga thermotolerans TaxID=1758176 RepID=UPI00273D283D|nr:hypothetical protein [Roseivirga thermotolerans]MEC7753528.1 hypothetical protein [Bacteroidota bacterium]